MVRGYPEHDSGVPLPAPTRGKPFTLRYAETVVD